MEKYEHIRKFYTDFCDVDFKDELLPSVLLKRFEEIACSSADELGYGYSYLLQNSLAFMVTEIKTVFVRPIRLLETVSFSTWPTAPKRYTFGREFKAYDKEGKAVLFGTSKWALIDVVAKKPAPSSVLALADFSDGNKYSDVRSYPFSDGKIEKFEPKDGVKKYEVKIGYSDYDHNGHTNNTKYADYCFNCFSVEEMKSKRVSFFAISFVKQSFEGETLSFYRKDGDSTLICGFNENDEPVVRAEIRFEV